MRPPLATKGAGGGRSVHVQTCKQTYLRALLSFQTNTNKFYNLFIPADPFNVLLFPLMHIKQGQIRRRRRPREFLRWLSTEIFTTLFLLFIFI